MDRANLNRILNEVIKEAQEVKIPVPANISEEIIINPRPKKRYGCCRRKDGRFSIEVSEFAVDCEEKSLRQIIAHEVIHTCRGCYDHGEKWKKYAKLMNDAYGYNIKRTSSLKELGIERNEETEKQQKIRYIIKCKKCGKEYPRQRATRVTQNIRKYRCKCGGRLTLIEPENKNRKTKWKK